MGMVPPENRRKADGSYRAQKASVGARASLPASPKRQANNGWVPSILSYRDLARGRTLDCRPSLQLFRLFQRPYLVRAVPRHGRSLK